MDLSISRPDAIWRPALSPDLCGAGIAAAEICRPSSLGSGQTRRNPRPRHAGYGGKRPAGERGRARSIGNRTAPPRGTRLPANGIPKEVAPLVFAFNGTLERLENEFKERQRFLIDAAHELRTPIAIMKAKYYLQKNLSKKPALAVVLHGCTQIPADYDVCSGWSKLADKHASHCSTRNRCGADGHRNGGGRSGRTTKARSSSPSTASKESGMGCRSTWQVAMKKAVPTCSTSAYRRQREWPVHGD